MKDSPRIILNVVLILVILSGAGFAANKLGLWIRKPEQKEPRRIVPRVLAPPLQPRVNRHVEIRGFGSARPRVRLKIIPQVTGTLVEKAPDFLTGKYVGKGQVLLRIDPTDYLLAVERAEKRIELVNAQLGRLSQEEKNLQQSERIEAERRDVAKRKVSRILQLLEAGAASDDELDRAKEALLARRAQLQNISNQLALIGPLRSQLRAEIAAAGVELRQAQTNLQRCTILSPVTGRVLSRLVEVGERVLAGANCGEIYGTDIMEVPVSISAGDLQWLDRESIELQQQGTGASQAEPIAAQVSWTRPGTLQSVTWDGCVERIEAGLEAETRTATLVVRVVNSKGNGSSGAGPSSVSPAAGDGPPPNDGKPMLEMNMFCDVTVLGKKLPRFYVLPRRAILPDGNVYVVVDGRLEKRSVRVARLIGEQATILPDGGLQDGDRVVTGPIPAPVVGMAVEAVDSQQAEQ